MNRSFQSIWADRAALAQNALQLHFWDENKAFYKQGFPQTDSHNEFQWYWWNAHAVDVLLDGYLRNGDAGLIAQIDQVFAGVKERNNGTMFNDYHDDMEWMALATLRVFDATGGETYRNLSLALWNNIKTGWNDAMGGGIAWRKTQLDYKNTPANAPASILAARLYQRFGSEDDFDWAKKIFDWNRKTLVDPQTGFVWDGINRQGDGNIDKDWRFTYCQGVYIGACVELFRITRENGYLNEATRTFRAADSLANPQTGILRDEGDGDCGLFKGIFIRYILQLASVLSEGKESVRSVIRKNAESLWHIGRDTATGLFGTAWDAKPGNQADLSAELSGVMLLEAAASLGLDNAGKKE